MAFDRRRFLKLSASSLVSVAALPPLSCGGTAEGGNRPPQINPADYDDGVSVSLNVWAIPEEDDVFPIGMQSGSVRAQSVVLTGYGTDGATKTLRVWRDADDAGEIVLVHEEALTPSEAGTFRVTIEGLAPYTDYHYALFSEVDGGRSVISHFRTALPNDALWPVKIAALTCTNQRYQPWTVLERTAVEPWDVCCHLGDVSYNDGAVTAEQYREKWRATLRDTGYRALQQAGSMYVAWDDHEFANNLNPETLPPEQLEAARTTFYEAIAQEEGEGGRLWSSYRWGRTVEFIVLDCRTERRPSTQAGDDAIYLSDEQMAFFKERLASSPCHFKVVLNSVPITQMPELWALASDRWQGYAAQRDEILQFIDDNNLQNIFFLSGDFHVGFVGRVQPEGPLSRLWEIAVGPSGNLGNPLGGLVELNPEEYTPLVFPRPQFEYGKAALSMTTLEFDPFADAVRVRFIDPDGGEGGGDLVLYDGTLKSQPLGS